jgi:phosphatidylglycerophosphate synthase
MSESLKELRERIQGPRRPHDTWYGRNVMRRFSIYLTVFFARMGASPSLVTLLGVFTGLLGAFCLWIGWWGWGLFFVNGWFLLDHVDGELARLGQSTSATGVYFDTVVNAIVPPFTFLALGIGLRQHTGRELPFFLGLVASYASLMLLVVGHCESATLLRCAKGPVPSDGPARPGSAKAVLGSLCAAVSFPAFLPAATATLLLTTFVLPGARPLFLTVCLFLYAVTATVVWIAALAHAVWTREPDRKLSGR